VRGIVCIYGPRIGDFCAGLPHAGWCAQEGVRRSSPSMGVCLCWATVHLLVCARGCERLCFCGPRYVQLEVGEGRCELTRIWAKSCTFAQSEMSVTYSLALG
jgi:hypothetical protein